MINCKQIVFENAIIEFEKYLIFEQKSTNTNFTT